MIYMVWSAAACAATEQSLTLQQPLEAAIESNPVISATRQRRQGAQRQGPQNYAPDPTFTCGKADSSKHFIAAVHTHNFRAQLGLRGAALQATITQLYQSAQFAKESAEQFKGALIPLADEQNRVASIAYQIGKVDFLTHCAPLPGAYAASRTYLKHANQFLAGEAVLEQTMGVQFPR